MQSIYMNYFTGWKQKPHELNIIMFMLWVVVLKRLNILLKVIHIIEGVDMDLNSSTLKQKPSMWIFYSAKQTCGSGSKWKWGGEWIACHEAQNEGAHWSWSVRMSEGPNWSWSVSSPLWWKDCGFSKYLSTFPEGDPHDHYRVFKHIGW